MPDDNSPQLGGQDHDDAPMISGRSTKIIVSARGAYEARNIKELFNAMEMHQQAAFQQVVVGQAAIFRSQIEQTAESQPILQNFLHSLDSWLISSETILVAHRLGYEFEFETSDVTRPDMVAIASSFQALLTVPTFPRQEPQLSIKRSELSDWIVETGWAILQGKTLPPLLVDEQHIENLMTNLEYWYRKGDIGILVHLLTDDQQAQFKRAMRQQVIWHIDTVPINRWSPVDRQVIVQAHQWFTNGQTLSTDELNIEVGKRSIKYKRWNPRFVIMNGLLHIFAESGQFPLAHYAGLASNIAAHVKTLIEGGSRNDMQFDAHTKAHEWQLETVWAILHDHPIPPLGDPD